MEGSNVFAGAVIFLLGIGFWPGVSVAQEAAVYPGHICQPQLGDMDYFTPVDSENTTFDGLTNVRDDRDGFEYTPSGFFVIREAGQENKATAVCPLSRQELSDGFETITVNAYGEVECGVFLQHPDGSADRTPIKQSNLGNVSQTFSYPSGAPVYDGTSYNVWCELDLNEEDRNHSNKSGIYSIKVEE